ncbi:MAG: hypothetical protein K0S56_3512 [Microvirga sp.]|jgi:hypothetical protein|nr:hypothetical protein [Microvirga sp.]
MAPGLLDRDGFLIIRTMPSAENPFTLFGIMP